MKKIKLEANLLIKSLMLFLVTGYLITVAPRNLCFLSESFQSMENILTWVSKGFGLSAGLLAMIRFRKERTANILMFGIILPIFGSKGSSCGAFNVTAGLLILLGSACLIVFAIAKEWFIKK